MKTPLTDALRRHVEALEKEEPGSEEYDTLIQETRILADSESKLLSARSENLAPWAKGIMSLVAVAFLVSAETLGHGVVSRGFSLIPKA